MRVVFFGTAEFAVPSLERLAGSSHEVVVCITQPDRPQGRGLALAPPPVKQAAVRLKLPVAQPGRLSAEPFSGPRPDVGVLAAYGKIVPPDVLTLPTHGILGVHPSLLPKYRGAAPVAWAILNGESQTGMTIYRLNDRLDAGDILLQRAIPIGPQDDAKELTDHLARLGADMLLEGLTAIIEGRAAWAAQDEARATYAPKLEKPQGRIDWRQSAVSIDRLVRAMTPWPGAVTEWHGASLKVWKAAVYGGCVLPGAVPGTVLRVTGGAVTVAAGSDAVELLMVQPPGKRPMSVKEFLAGHPVRVGDLFGSGNRSRHA